MKHSKIIRICLIFCFLNLRISIALNKEKSSLNLQELNNIDNSKGQSKNPGLTQSKTNSTADITSHSTLYSTVNSTANISTKADKSSQANSNSEKKIQKIIIVSDPYSYNKQIYQTWPGYLSKYFDPHIYPLENFSAKKTPLKPENYFTQVQKNGEHPVWNETSYQLSLGSNPQYVVLMLGSGDLQFFDEDKFKQDYIELLRSYLNLASAPTVYVVTPPPLRFSSTCWNHEHTMTCTFIQNHLIPQTILNAARSIGYPDELIINGNKKFGGSADKAKNTLFQSGQGIKDPVAFRERSEYIDFTEAGNAYLASIIHRQIHFNLNHEVDFSRKIQKQAPPAQQAPPPQTNTTEPIANNDEPQKDD